jgi:RNA-directed DNA polymerase
LKEELRKRRHEPIPETGQLLGQVLNGFFNYFAVPTNFQALGFPLTR